MRFMSVAVVAMVIAAACGGSGDSAGASTSSTVAEPSTTETTSTTVSPAQLERAQSVGDVAAGELLFATEVKLVGQELACSDCHTLDGVEGRSPTLAGIAAVAGRRVPGMTDIDYLRASIVDPGAFQTKEWASVMPRTYADGLSDEEIDDLIAFLLTR